MAETKKSGGQRKTKQSAELENRKAALIAANTKRRHTISVVMFAVGILILALSFIGDSAAENPSAWDAIHAFLHGLFGIAVFVVGPVIMYIAVMISADITKSTVTKRMFQLLLLVLLLCAAAQVIFVGHIGDPAAADAAFGDNVSYAYNKGKELSGGGVAGLVLGAPLLLFGQVGAIIILILITFVAVMLLADKSLGDLFNIMKKPAERIKERHDQHEEERRYIEPELKRMEDERRQEKAHDRERRQTERELKKQERALSEEERRRNKFASIANVTTGAQQEVTEQDKKEAQQKQLEIKGPVDKQRQESKEFQKDLKDYLTGKYDGKKQDPVPSIVPVEEKSDAEGGPYRPDTPKFADNEGDEFTGKHLNPVVKHDSLIDPELAAKATEAPAQADDDPAPWEDGAYSPIGDTSAVQAAETETVQPDVQEKPASDIVEAIKDFTKEQEERARAAEDNARVLGTVIEEDENGQRHVSEIIADSEQYTLPPTELLNDVVHDRSDDDINAEIQHNAETLVSTLKSFGVETTFLEAARGPSVTRYELKPAPGVKISKITGLVDDIALNLAAAGVRIEAPIPNKSAVGIEVPNKKTDSVPFREMVDSREFRETQSKLGAVLGKSISGEVVICDVAKMPHMLIAGTTGSGKSVCVNSIIMSILFRSTPEDVRLLMIDPKAVEFMVYNGIPHLLIPVVTDPKKAAGALAWAVTEMLNRYKMFSDCNVRNLEGYNKLAKTREDLEPMPQIVIFIDELADLMMASPGEVEDSICRLAQMARAAGMHLVIATQRPSVNVVTGVIKANIPSRIALKVASQVDSRTIIDGAGAEKLLGKGDMLYFPSGMAKPMRVQGCWVSDKEVERVVEFIKNSFVLDYDESVIEEIERQAEIAAQKAEKGGKSRDDEDAGGPDVSDDKLDEAIEVVIEAGQASTSYLQRRLKLGYGRAARLIDTMEQLGVVGGFEGGKPRQVLMTKQEWYERKMNKDE